MQTHAQWRQGERRQRTLASQGAARSRKTARANAMSSAGRARERAAAHAATTTSPAPHTLCLAPPPRPSSFPSRDGKWGEGASSSFSFFLYPPAPPPPLSPSLFLPRHPSPSCPGHNTRRTHPTPPHTHACTPERPRPRLQRGLGRRGGHRGEPTDSSCCRRKSGSAPAWQRSLAASLSPVVAWVKSGVSFESCPRATHEHLQRQSRPHTSPRCRHAHTRGGRACQRG